MERRAALEETSYKSSSKISKMTNIMAKARLYLPPAILKTTYPYLTLIVILCGKVSIKKKVRTITFSKYNEQSRPLFVQLKLLDIYELDNYLTALFMYSYFNHDKPNNFNNYFAFYTTT